MNNTALRAEVQSANNTHMVFADEEHEKFYYEKLEQARYQDCYHKALIYVLGISEDTRNHFSQIYDIKTGNMLGDGLPHTPQTIATFTRHQIGTVERALKLFTEFGFVEVLTDGAYYMADIQLLIGQSSTEGERKRKERMRLKRQNLLPSGQADICPPYSREDICPPEIRDKRLDIRDKSIENRECDNNAHAYGKYGNVFISGKEISELQKELSDSVLQDYIERLSEYMESTGREYKSHAATIRRWAGADRKGAAPMSRNRDYTVKEGETI